MKAILKKFKKVTAVLLVVVMLVGVMAISVSAHSGSIKLPKYQDFVFEAQGSNCHVFFFERFPDIEYTVRVKTQPGNASSTIQMFIVPAGTGWFDVHIRIPVNVPRVWICHNDALRDVNFTFENCTNPNHR